MAEIFPNLRRWKDTQIHDAQRIPNRLSPKKATLRYIVITLSTIKEITLQAAKEKWLVKGGFPPINLNLWLEFSTENFQAQREGIVYLKYWNKKNGQPRILHPVKLCFRNIGERKTCLNKEKQKEFIHITPVLDESLTGLLQEEIKDTN